MRRVGGVVVAPDLQTAQTQHSDQILRFLCRKTTASETLDIWVVTYSSRRMTKRRQDQTKDQALGA